MWTMQPVREFTIVRTSFNLSPQDGQVFFVSLSKTATTSARNNSMARSVSKWIREYTLGSGNTKEIFLVGRHSVGALPFCIAYALADVRFPLSRQIPAT
jgi:hypothetical protein